MAVSYLFSVFASQVVCGLKGSEANGAPRQSALDRLRIDMHNWQLLCDGFRFQKATSFQQFALNRMYSQKQRFLLHAAVLFRLKFQLNFR